MDKTIYTEEHRAINCWTEHNLLFQKSKPARKELTLWN